MLTDHLVLRTVDGAADLLVEELRALPTIRGVRQTSAETVECVLDGSLDQLAACTLYSTVEVCDLETSLRAGVLSTLEQPVRFRVGDPDPVCRQQTIAAIEQRFGWMNRPADWDVNLERSGPVQFGPLSWTRRFGRVERLPWSTNLIVAEVLVRLAKLRPGDRVLDPFCGTGTILRAVRRREPTVHPIGIDHDPHALSLNKPPCPLIRSSADALPLLPATIDRVIANLPFGKQVGSHRNNRSLYPVVLKELDRLLTNSGRAVLLTEDKRLLRTALDQQRALKLVRERLLRYNGATPTAYVLTGPRLSKTATNR
ncbi:TRM11 family SAM-dependent methyltransferase [Kribbella sp. NPDC048928]|uniref:TRM11 family SAM-dependent methyltransferase n=1 Tax=Kribbella sp. NPDC048928 TaxID=3364111 RepID=UPI0037249B62